MTRHSRNCTAGAFFTSAEREKLGQYGTQRERLGRDSLRSSVACVLCLREPACDPVACAGGGHVFCRECLLTHLVTCKRMQQRTLIAEERLRLAAEQALEAEEEARQQERIEAFTALNGPGGAKRARLLQSQLAPEQAEKGGREQPGAARMPTTSSPVEPGRARMTGTPSASPSTLVAVPSRETKRPLATEKAPAGGAGSSPSIVPPVGAPKLAIYCPAAADRDHTISMKQVTPVRWTLSPEKTGAAICSVCTNDLRLMTASLTLIKPCGHVFCNKCIKNIAPRTDVDVGADGGSGETEITNPSPNPNPKTSTSKLGPCPECSQPVLDTLLLAGEGSGFAGGGRAPNRLEVKKYDPAFI